jgi:hypothetical protein
MTFKNPSTITLDPTKRFSLHNPQVTVEEAARGPGEAEQQIFGASEELWDNCCVTAYFDLEVRVWVCLQRVYVCRRRARGGMSDACGGARSLT